MFVVCCKNVALGSFATMRLACESVDAQWPNYSAHLWRGDKDTYQERPVCVDGYWHTATVVHLVQDLPAHGIRKLLRD